MTKDKLNKSVREWYLKQYPTDELGADINPCVTFGEIGAALIQYDGNISVYSMIGVDDSTIRERVFDKLASLMDTPYESIYDLWLS